MRDPERIDRVVEKLRQLWHKMPDQRLGQLLLNVHQFSDVDWGTGIWHVEDDIWEKTFEKISKDGFT